MIRLAVERFVDRGEFHRHALDVLRRHEVSPCEDAVLGIVYYHITLPPLGIAQYAKAYDEDEIMGTPYGPFPLEDYLRAIESCVAKGWLTVLTPEDFEREERRRLLSQIPEVLDKCYRPGDVAFTEAGFLLERQLSREIMGPEFEERQTEGWNWDADRQRLDVYAEDEEACRLRLEEIAGNVEQYTGRAGRVTNVEGPRPIGPWKPDRFTTVASGFHAVMKVELDGPT
jgi:hypothetical protein